MSKNKIGVTKNYPWFDTKTNLQSKWLNAYFETQKQKHLLDMKNGYPLRTNSTKQRDPNNMIIQDFDNKGRGEKSNIQDIHNRTGERTINDVGGCTLGLGLVCLIIMILTLIGSIIAVATPFWFGTGSYDIGLFQLCNIETKVCSEMSNYLASSSSSMQNTWRCVKAINLTGSCLLLIAIIGLGIFMRCVVVIDYRRISLAIVISILAMLACIAFIVGSVLMATYYIDNSEIYTLGWSFYLAASTAGVSFVNFCLLIVYSCLLAFA